MNTQNNVREHIYDNIPGSKALPKKLSQLGSNYANLPRIKEIGLQTLTASESIYSNLPPIQSLKKSSKTAPVDYANESPYCNIPTSIVELSQPKKPRPQPVHSHDYDNIPRDARDLNFSNETPKANRDPLYANLPKTVETTSPVVVSEYANLPSNTAPEEQKKQRSEADYANLPKEIAEARTKTGVEDKYANLPKAVETTSPVVVSEYANLPSNAAPEEQKKQRSEADYANLPKEIAEAKTTTEVEDKYANLPSESAMPNHVDDEVILNGLREEEEAAALLYSQDKYSDALNSYESLLKHKKAHFGDSHPEVASCLSSIGSCYSAEKKLQQAVLAHQEAWAIRLKVLGSSHPSVAISLNNIGACYLTQTKYDEALKFFQDALKIWKETPKNFEVDPLHIASALQNLGICLSSKGLYADALTSYNKALKIWGDEKSADVALILGNRGICLSWLERNEDAIESHSRALELLKITSSENNPVFITTYNNIGSCLSSKDKYDDALGYHQKALDLCQKIPGNSLRAEAAVCWVHMGNVYKRQKKFKEALEVYEKALEIRETLFGAYHITKAQTLNSIGHLYYAQNRFDHALKLFESVRDIEIHLSGSESYSVAMTLNNIAACHNALKQFKIAEKVFQEALRVFRHTLTDSHPLFLATALQNMGVFYMSREDSSKAVSYLKEAIDLRKQNSSEETEQLGTALQELGLAYVKQKKYAEALNHLEKANAIAHKFFGEEFESSTTELTQLSALGKCCSKLKGQEVKAVQYLQDASKLAQKHLGAFHKQTIKLEDRLAAAEKTLKKAQKK